MISTSSLSHSYNSKLRFDFPDVSCNAQESLLILGQSGVGKTTLLHILAGILKPTQGEVTLKGTSLYNLNPNAIDKFRGKNIGIVFQKPHFIGSISAEENLYMAQKVATGGADKAHVKSLLDQLQLSHRRTAKTHTMSQGEQQRLSIARALVNMPEVILADEPTSALDDVNCQKVVQLLDEQASQVGAALIIVTHDNRLKDIYSDYVELNNAIS